MSLFKQQILLVEGDKDSRELACLYLTQAGYQVTASCTNPESLVLASTGRFKLYLLGEGFEDRTNLDLCQQIRKFDLSTPILLCSAWAYPADIDRGRKAGAQAYFTKPCDYAELVRVAKQLVFRTIGNGIGKTPVVTAQLKAFDPRHSASRVEYLLSAR